MQKVQKRKSDTVDVKKTSSKKVKFSTDKSTDIKKPKTEKKFSKPDKPKTFQKNGNFNTKQKFDKIKKFVKPQENKPTDWNEFKKKKKEVRDKRKQGKNLYDVITKAKQIGEKLRIKKLEGGTQERSKLVKELHELMGNKGNYVKFVLAHDMARIVQYMLKFGALNIRQEIAKELVPETVQMLQSKYGKFVVKRLLKYGNAANRADCLKTTYGHAVKLASHGISAPIFEYAYSTWASPADKINLIQEFFGDMYKQSKDPNVKHLRDVYAKTQDMKSAVLGATKANLLKILNKDLLDSGLIQSVLCQFLEECSAEDKAEIISQLCPHFVVISNSKDGAKVAMQCIWHGTNKEKKIAMKALKEHAIELCKHEHGHTAIIALLDAIDDTILLNKLILDEISNKAGELISDDWGRKVLLWLVRPADKAHFHPQFIKELQIGRESSTSKKDAEIRQAELLKFCSKILLSTISENVKDWFEQSSRALVTLAILKSGSGEELQDALKSIAAFIMDLDWKLKLEDNEVIGIEDPGIHMILKKLAQNDKLLIEKGEDTFGSAVVELLDDDVIQKWIKLNRGCFLLLTIFENNEEEVQETIKKKLQSHLKILKKQSTAGAKILLKKITGQK